MLGALIIGVVVISVLIGMRQYRHIVKPFQDLRGSMRAIRATQNFHPISVSGDAEIQAVVEEFNLMTAELASMHADLERKVSEKGRELARSERLASVGHLAAGVAHEINNPLSVIATHAEMALNRIQKDGVEKSSDRTVGALDIIHRESFRCKSIIEKLLVMTRGNSGLKAATYVSPVIDEVISMVLSLPKYQGGTIETRRVGIEAVVAEINEVEMKQVLTNLLINALDAIDLRKGHVMVEAEWQSRGRVVIRVTDDGCGIEPHYLDHVFEPFYSDKPMGIGLGLSISHAIVSDHDGHLTVQSKGKGHGSCFTIELPARHEA